MSNRWEKWRVSKKEAGMSLLAFLREKCTGFSSVKAIKRAVEGKSCTVNACLETFSSFVLHEGDLVALDQEAGISLEKNREKSMEILFEDEGLLICNKSAHIPSELSLLRPF